MSLVIETRFRNDVCHKDVESAILNYSDFRKCDHSEILKRFPFISMEEITCP